MGGSPALGLVAVVVGGGIVNGSNPPEIALSLMVSSSLGHEVSGDVRFSAAASVTQTNQAIENRARRMIADTFGLEVPNTIPVRLFGGATS